MVTHRHVERVGRSGGGERKSANLEKEREDSLTKSGEVKKVRTLQHLYEGSSRDREKRKEVQPGIKNFLE